MAKLAAKHPYGVSRSFFQSLIPYLQSSFVSLSVLQVVGQWFQDEPHPSNRLFLTGHYGIYFGLFSQELRKEEKRSQKHEQSGFLVVFHPEPLKPFIPEFFISQANQRIQNDIQTLRSVTKDLLSTLAVVKPRCSLKQLYMRRNFSTTSHYRRQKIDVAKTFHSERNNKVPETHVQATESHTKALEAETAYDQIIQSNVGEQELENFETSFLANQLGRMESIFHNHSNVSELNTIYPIYQSLQRNEIDLPSVNAYNIVLQSICHRSLDNEGTLESIEAKLTSLLTVYQDLLEACSRNDKLLPDMETYNIILPCVFDGAIQTIQLASESSVPSYKASLAHAKAEEYAKVGLDLLMSIKNKNELNSDKVFPPLFMSLTMFPHLLTSEIASLVVTFANSKSQSCDFYKNLIVLAKNFIRKDTLNMNKKELYGFVSSIYGNYKHQLQSVPVLGDGEFEIYSAMIETLVSSENVPVATKFLDSILLDFKDSLLAGHNTRLSEISKLLLTYLEALMDSGSRENLLLSFSLLEKFRAVSYLPEPSVTVYNTMINRFISIYIQQEYEKTHNEQVAEQQISVYKKIWHLYNYAVIRKDFQEHTICLGAISKTVSCRDSLLNLSLDLGDHPNIARLIKEILVKKHIVGDWNITKKLCQYLLNGAVAHNNSYYQNLLWNFVEQQAKYFEKDSAELNLFLSEHVNYLLINDRQTFNIVLNLMMIFNAFEKFKLLTDNAYGLMTVSSYLSGISSEKHLTSADKIKILQYQACLIIEFEDPDNHYTELCAELQELKKSSSRVFIELFSTLESDSELTRDILQACSILGLEKIADKKPFHSLDSSIYELDLSAQLNINTETGMEAFVSYFRQGYSFTAETWDALITQNFALDVLEKEAFFSMAEFVSRLRLSQTASTHFQKLISLQNDKVTIKILQNLLIEKDSNTLGNSEFLKELSSHVALTDNKYLLSILARNFAYLYSLNQLPEWIANIFRKFNAAGLSAPVREFVDTHQSSIVALDISNPASAQMVSTITDAYLNSGKIEKVGELFQTLFSGVERNRILIESDTLLSCLFNYYIVSGEHSKVLKQFGMVRGRSSELDHLFEFSELLDSIQRGQRGSSFQIKSEQSLALLILAEPDLMKMKAIYDNNQKMITNKYMFFDMLVTNLTKAASLLSTSYYSRVFSRFESVVKFCKVLGIKRLNVKSMTKVVRLLATTKANSLLNIVFNKFVVNNSIVSNFNFYFLQVNVSSDLESKLLLQEFSSALKVVGDILNAKTIDTFES